MDSRIWGAALLLLGGCASQPTVGAYSVGGSVSGLTTTTDGVLLTDAGGSSVYVSGNGRFSIENAFEDGATYEVTAVNESSPTRCVLSNSKGTIQSANVDDVMVICGTFAIGGTVNNLNAVGLVIENNGEAIALSTEGTFEFQKQVVSGTPYAVTIAQQPEGAFCTIVNASGTTVDRDIENVTIDCTAEEEGVASATEPSP